MFDLGTQELIVIFIVAFLVFGPKRLPELGRTIGKGMRELKSAMRGVKETLEEAESEVSGGMNEVTREIKGIKNDLEESVYKGLEEKFSQEQKKDEEDVKGTDEKSEPEKQDTLLKEGKNLLEEQEKKQDG